MHNLCNGPGECWVLFYVVRNIRLGYFVVVFRGVCNTSLVKNLGVDKMLDHTTPKDMKYKSLSIGLKYDMMVHLVPYKPLEAFKAELALKGMVIDMMSTLKTIVWNWYNKFTFAKHKFVPFVMTTNVGNLQEVLDLIEAKVIVDSGEINKWLGLQHYRPCNM